MKGSVTHEQIADIAAHEMGGFRWRTRTLTPLVHLLPSGTWSHYGRAQLRAMEAVLRVELPTREEGAERLVRRYLAAFGPATQEDLLRFAGIRAGDVRPGLDKVALRRFRDERGRLLLDLPCAPLPEADVPAPVRFLPKWDSSILAYTRPVSGSASSSRTNCVPRETRRRSRRGRRGTAPTPCRRRRSPATRRSASRPRLRPSRAPSLRAPHRARPG
jgi:hypothetical protein